MTSPVVIVDTNNVPQGTSGNPLIATVTVGAGSGNVTLTSLYPVGATPIAATSGTVGNATAAATLAAATGLTTYISGFDVTGTGSTTALPVAVTVGNVSAGNVTLTYAYAAAAGVLVENTPLNIRFNPPLPCKAGNTTISVSCPTLGIGNTNNTVNAYGFQV